MKLKTKGIIKKVALALAGVAAITAVGFGVKAIVDYTKNDLKKITLSYDVGNLGADGKYVANESTLYTKESFPCDGLQVKLDFDNKINYQIFYYDDLDNFVSSTPVMDSAFEGRVWGTNARIVIIPTDDEDDKISFTEKFSYPKQMTVKVAKNQSLKYLKAGTSRLMVVDNQSDLIFQTGNLDIASDSTVTYTPSPLTKAVTSIQFLDVSKYKSIKAVDGVLSGKLTLYVYEFERKNDSAHLIKASGEYVETLTFADNTDLVLLIFICTDNETSVSFTDEMMSKLPNCFALKK
ncbi:MAG: hypothetical protein K2L12_01550 [Clostridia bacterium]|nr:hypothetical protein [Clostridia bacterium]